MRLLRRIALISGSGARTPRRRRAHGARIHTGELDPRSARAVAGELDRLRLTPQVPDTALVGAAVARAAQALRAERLEYGLANGS